MPLACSPNIFVFHEQLYSIKLVQHLHVFFVEFISNLTNDKKTLSFKYKDAKETPGSRRFLKKKTTKKEQECLILLPF